MKFVSLGSGSSGNCYLLQSGETSILLDAGISMRTLKKHLKDFDLSLEDDVAAVFVTHDHADHIKAVGNIACDCGKTIYATQLVHEGIANNRCLKISIPRSMSLTTVATVWAMSSRQTVSVSALSRTSDTLQRLFKSRLVWPIT